MIHSCMSPWKVQPHYLPKCLRARNHFELPNGIFQRHWDRLYRTGPKSFLIRHFFLIAGRIEITYMISLCLAFILNNFLGCLICSLSFNINNCYFASLACQTKCYLFANAISATGYLQSNRSNSFYNFWNETT